MLRLGAEATGLLAGAMLFSCWATPASADPNDSPIAGSHRLAPAPPDYFAGRLKPVPELVERQEIKTQVFVPWDPVSYDVAERLPEQFRQTKARTASGIWKLTEYYAGLDHQFDYTTPEPTLSAFGNAIDRWQAGSPKSPTPVVIKGLFLIQYAEAATFLATTTDDLTQQKLELQKQRFEQAYQYMALNKLVGSGDPHWYATMLRIMGYRCANESEMMKTLQEGADRYPDYYQMYFDFIYGFAQCGRGFEDLDAAIVNVVKLGLAKTRDTDNLGMYARTYWYAAGFVPGGELSAFPRFDWQNMKAGFEDVLAQHPEPWNINNYASFACKAGDVPKSRELLPKALAFPVVNVWGSSEYFAACWDRAGLPPPTVQGQ